MQILSNLLVETGPGDYTVRSWDDTEFDEISVNLDAVLTYQPLGVDFGPHDLPTTLRFVRFVEYRRTKGPLRIAMIDDDKRRANMFVLIFAYLILTRKRSVAKLKKLLSEIRKDFHLADFVCPLANKFPEVFQLTLEDVVSGLLFARGQNWLHTEICPKQIEFDQHPDNGDFNFVVPGKFLAFAGPSSAGVSPHSLVPKFRAAGVKTVVRLNHPCYSASDFRSAGMDHHDLIFPDGSCPESRILDKFMEISETSEGVVAVHCKAGLGRTGTLIGYWIIKNFRVSARTAIAWLRIARPGSVLGPQQQFLESFSENMQPSSLNAGSADPGQGGRLLKRKRTWS
jgi:cell division cycle 14